MYTGLDDPEVTGIVDANATLEPWSFGLNFAFFSVTIDGKLNKAGDRLVHG